MRRVVAAGCLPLLTAASIPAHEVVADRSYCSGSWASSGGTLWLLADTDDAGACAALTAEDTRCSSTFWYIGARRQCACVAGGESCVVTGTLGSVVYRLGCADSATYRTPGGFGCGDFSGVDCLQAATNLGLTPVQWQALTAACPVACGTGCALRVPTAAPAAPPTAAPTALSGTGPSAAPTGTPTAPPAAPTGAPTAPPAAPTGAPVTSPTSAPAVPTAGPSGTPTAPPTLQPAVLPTAPPVAGVTAPPPSAAPSSPTASPAPPTARPSTSPSAPPASNGTDSNSTAPPLASNTTAQPAANTTRPTAAPTVAPAAANLTAQPSGAPTAPPTSAPAAGAEAVLAALADAGWGAGTVVDGAEQLGNLTEEPRVAADAVMLTFAGDEAAATASALAAVKRAVAALLPHTEDQLAVRVYRGSVTLAVTVVRPGTPAPLPAGPSDEGFVDKLTGQPIILVAIGAGLVVVIAVGLACCCRGKSRDDVGGQLNAAGSPSDVQQQPGEFRTVIPSALDGDGGLGVTPPAITSAVAEAGVPSWAKRPPGVYGAAAADPPTEMAPAAPDPQAEPVPAEAAAPQQQ